MKLFTQYNRVNILVTIITFVIGSIAFYFVLQYVLISQLDRALFVEQQEITDYVKLRGTLPDRLNTKHQWIDYQLAVVPIVRPKPASIPFYNKEENESESIRQLQFTVVANGKSYLITVNQSETETEDLLKLIILVTVAMIAVILVANYMVNRRLIAKTLQPFYHTVAGIKDLGIHQPLDLPEEKIEEFNLLNQSLNNMTQRIHKDYLALKTFTENASHEMQTPLAVIRLQIDALLQDSDGNEKVVRQLLSIEDAALRLSRLHQSLLLLTKLENKQFAANESVNMEAIIRRKLAERQESIIAKPLFLNVHAQPVILNFHHHLAEILINNLLNNAIKYSSAGGVIEIKLLPGLLTIRNSATSTSLDTGKVFTRFYKVNQAHEGTGLGLAIVKEICGLAGYTATYHYEKEMHDFTIRFVQ